MSFIECTAMSARPSRIAISSSLMNRPLPPTVVSEPWMRSPSVTIGNRLTVRPGWAVRRCSATCSACHRASGLFRVAMRTSRFMRHSAMLMTDRRGCVMGGKLAVFWLAILACAGTAAADDETEAAIGDTRFTAGDDVQIDEPVEGSAFAAGARVGVTARVERSVYLSGGDVTVSAPIGRNLYMAGGDLRLESVVYGRLRAAGGHVRIAREALVDESASLAGGSIEVDGGIGGSLRAYGESIVINGAIGGDLELTGERIRIGPDARIAGSITYRSGHPIAIDPQAVVSGEVTERQKERRWLRRIGRGETFVGSSFSLGLVLIGALMILLLPRFTREAGASLRERPGVSGGVGIAMVLGVPLMLL